MKDRIIVALDTKSLDIATMLVGMLSPDVRFFKIGSELATAAGVPEAVRRIKAQGGEVFLDLKWNDTPRTVGEAVAAASNMGISMATVHASAGIRAMERAVERRCGMTIVAVTVLTSLAEQETFAVFNESVNTKVLQFARDAVSSGITNIVCSPRELLFLRRFKGEFNHITKIVAGVRPHWTHRNDHSRLRIATPKEAVRWGADFLVIGRPITHPPLMVGGPREALSRIATEIGRKTINT